MRSKCRSIQEYLSDFIDRGLSERQNVRVKNHLRSCSACRCEFESLRRTTGLLNYYVEPEPPKGYHDRFWRDLQFTIEQAESQPMWWTGTALWGNACRTGQEFFGRVAYYCRTLMDTPCQWLLRGGRLAPTYSFIFMIMAGIFVAKEFMESPDAIRRIGESQLRSPLEEYPIRLVHTQENRELVTKREKVPGLSQGLSDQERHAPQKVNHQLEMAELPNQGLANYGHSTFDETIETPRGHTDDSDVFPELIAFAQLATPNSALTTREFSGAVAINSPFPEKFEREGRQSNSSLRVLKHVTVRDLSLMEVYDSVKL